MPHKLLSFFTSHGILGPRHWVASGSLLTYLCKALLLSLPPNNSVPKPLSYLLLLCLLLYFSMSAVFIPLPISSSLCVVHWDDSSTCSFIASNFLLIFFSIPHSRSHSHELNPFCKIFRPILVFFPPISSTTLNQESSLVFISLCPFLGLVRSTCTYQPLSGSPPPID